MTTDIKQTKQDGEDTKLILYRIGILENGQQRIENKLDNQDTIKRGDLVEFRDTIISRITDVNTNLQGQINELKVVKADGQELKDFKKQIAAYGVFLSALAIALFSYLLTRIK